MTNFNLAPPCFIDAHTYYPMLLLYPFHTEIRHIQPRLSQRIDIIGYKSFDTMIYIALHEKNIGSNSSDVILFEIAYMFSIVNFDSLVA